MQKRAFLSHSKQQFVSLCVLNIYFGLCSQCENYNNGNAAVQVEKSFRPEKRNSSRDF